MSSTQVPMIVCLLSSLGSAPSSDSASARDIATGVQKDNTRRTDAGDALKKKEVDSWQLKNVPAALEQRYLRTARSLEGKKLQIIKDLNAKIGGGELFVKIRIRPRNVVCETFWSLHRPSCE